MIGTGQSGLILTQCWVRLGQNDQLESVQVKSLAKKEILNHFLGTRIEKKTENLELRSLNKYTKTVSK